MNHPMYVEPEASKPEEVDEDAPGCKGCFFREDGACCFIIKEPREIPPDVVQPEWCPKEET